MVGGLDGKWQDSAQEKWNVRKTQRHPPSPPHRARPGLVIAVIFALVSGKGSSVVDETASELFPLRAALGAMGRGDIGDAHHILGQMARQGSARTLAELQSGAGYGRALLPLFDALGAALTVAPTEHRVWEMLLTRLLSSCFCCFLHLRYDVGSVPEAEMGGQKGPNALTSYRTRIHKRQHETLDLGNAGLVPVTMGRCHAIARQLAGFPAGTARCKASSAFVWQRQACARQRDNRLMAADRTTESGHVERFWYTFAHICTTCKARPAAEDKD